MGPIIIVAGGDLEETHTKKKTTVNNMQTCSSAFNAHVKM